LAQALLYRERVEVSGAGSADVNGLYEISLHVVDGKRIWKKVESQSVWQ